MNIKTYQDNLRKKLIKKSGWPDLNLALLSRTMGVDVITLRGFLDADKLVSTQVLLKIEKYLGIE